MFKNNLLSIFFYLRNIFTKSSKNEYNKFFFERSNKIKRLCITLGYIFSSSRWTNRISNSVIENYLDDKADLNFLILKYRYSSTLQYSSYIKSFAKANFPTKHAYIAYVRLLKYLIISILLTTLLLVVMQFIVFIEFQMLSLEPLNKLILFLGYYILTPFYNLIQILYYLLPLYLYILLLNYFNIEIFQVNQVQFTNPNNLVTKHNFYQNEYNHGNLYLIIKLVNMVNLLETVKTPVSSIFFFNNSNLDSIYDNKKKLPLYFNLIQTEIKKPYLPLYDSSYEWATEVVSSYTEIKNLIKLKPLLNSQKSDTLILNTAANNILWKNSRWLYKFSVLNTHVTDSFYKLAEQKPLIKKSLLNEDSHNFNLWFKNIKTPSNKQNLNLNLFNSPLELFLKSRLNLNFILNTSNNATLQHLTFIEDSMSFLYKRFYMFNSIYLNTYLKTPYKLMYFKLDRSPLGGSITSDYVFKSVKYCTNTPTNAINFSYFINFNSESDLMYYTILFDNSFSYLTPTTEACVINFSLSYFKNIDSFYIETFMPITFEDYSSIS